MARSGADNQSKSHFAATDSAGTAASSISVESPTTGRIPYTPLAQTTDKPSHKKARLPEPVPVTVDGTIITGKKGDWQSPDQPGAHLGLDVQFVRFVRGDPDVAIGPITLECSSNEAKTNPSFWVCNTKTEFQEAFFSPVFALTFPIIRAKVNPLEDPACSVFQDGGGALPIIPERAPE